jgi:hypothetical protein
MKSDRCVGDLRRTYTEPLSSVRSLDDALKKSAPFPLSPCQIN